MKQRWHHLSLRERYFLIGGVFCLLTFLSYSLVWQPLQKKILLAQKKLEQHRQLLHQIHLAKPALKEWLNRRHQNAILPDESLSNMVHQSAAQAGMEIIKMQEEEKALRVWIVEVSFKKLVSWLFDLQYRHGIQTAYLDLVETGIPGIVEVQRLEFIRDVK